MTDIQTTWTDEQGETWVPFSDYMHLKAALKTERTKALRDAAEIAHYMPIIGDDAEKYADKVEEEILALITDEQTTEKNDKLTPEQAAALLEKQTYTYYGKDGRPVLARDLEDQLAAANGRIADLEGALGKLKYWFDTDLEVLDAMSTDELADHNRQAALIDAALITDDEEKR